MNLDAYDDMMGLEFGDYEGVFDGLFNPEMLKETLMASAAGGAAILGVTWGVKQLMPKIGLETYIQQPVLRSAVISGATFLLGIAAGRQVMRYNPTAGIGIVGGVGGIALANFLDVALSQLTGNPRMFSALGESDMLDGYSDNDGMAALAALEATSVESAPGAFQGFADPTVTPETLMGLEAAVVQQETLGGYAPYLS
jgi:hypothetical protein